MSVRRVLLALSLVAAATAPAAVAAEGAACGGGQDLETLTVRLDVPPTTVPAGTRVSIPLTVRRSAVPAAGIDLLLVLRHSPGFDGASYAAATTDTAGRAVLRPMLPARARDVLSVVVEATSDIAEVPCAGTVREHGVARGAWGRAVSAGR